jgi:hypothetical protein
MTKITWLQAKVVAVFAFTKDDYRSPAQAPAMRINTTNCPSVIGATAAQEDSSRNRPSVGAASRGRSSVGTWICFTRLLNQMIDIAANRSLEYTAEVRRMSKNSPTNVQTAALGQEISNRRAYRYDGHHAFRG